MMTEYSENNNNGDEEKSENICAPLVTLEFILTSKKKFQTQGDERTISD